MSALFLAWTARPGAAASPTERVASLGGLGAEPVWGSAVFALAVRRAGLPVGVWHGGGWLVAWVGPLRRRHDQGRDASLVENLGPWLVEGWSRQGFRILEQVDGGFALLLRQVDQDRAWLVRAPGGAIPWYLREDAPSAEGESGLRASTSLPSLASEAGVDRSLHDPVAVQQYLRYGFVPAPRTLFTRVRALEAGTLLELRGGVPRTRRLTVSRWHTTRVSGAGGTTEHLGAVLDAAWEHAGPAWSPPVEGLVEAGLRLLGRAAGQPCAVPDAALAAGADPSGRAVGAGDDLVLARGARFGDGPRRRVLRATPPWLGQALGRAVDGAWGDGDGLLADCLATAASRGELRGDTFHPRWLRQVATVELRQAQEHFEPGDARFTLRHGQSAGRTVGDRCREAALALELPDGVGVAWHAVAQALGADLRLPLADRDVIAATGVLDAASLRTLRHRALGPTHPPVALGDALRGPWRELGERLLADGDPGWQAHLRPDAVRELWEQHQGGHHDHGRRLWLVLAWTAWWQEVRS